MCLSAWVRSFYKQLKAGNHSLVHQALNYAHGLFQSERANMERMSETVPNTNYQSQHHFISHSTWDDRPVREENASKLNQRLGGTPYTGLLIDETAFTKKGDHSVGVARQWSGQLGKVENCQVAVFSALCDSDHASLLDARLYLPKKWTDDPERCEKAEVPKEHQVYQSKTQLALDLIDEADAFGVQYTWVGVDAGYGKDPAFLRGLVARKKSFMADVHKTQHIYTTDPLRKRPLPGRRGKEKKLTTTPKSLTVEEWVARQPKRKWKSVLLRQGSQEKHKAKVLLGHVWVWDGKEEKAHAWRLVVRRRGDNPKRPDDKYTLTNAPGDIPAKMMAWYQGQRFKIEQCFQEGKQELGLDDYQVRSWKAWHHHTTLTLMAMNFLLDEKIRFGIERPGISLPAIRRMLVALLPRCDFKTIMEQEFARAEKQEAAKGRASPS